MQSKHAHQKDVCTIHMNVYVLYCTDTCPQLHQYQGKQQNKHVMYVQYLNMI